MNAVVTGLGYVGAHGIGRQALAEALSTGAATLSPVDPLPGLRRRAGGARSAALVRHLDVGRFIPPLVARRLSRPSCFAVIAGRLALEDAGLQPSAQPDPAVAVVLSTAFGPAAFPQAMMDQMLDEGPEAASPALFTECVANAPAAQVAIHCRAGGTNLTLSERETGALAAVAQGSALIASGRARRVLVGAVEETTPLLHAILDRFGALASAAARPFAADRDGYLLAEGATVLVLESASDAEARGAAALATVRSAASAFDATAPAWGFGRRPASVARFLARAVPVGDLAGVVSGANGSVPGDAYEEACLAEVGPSLPRVAPKAVTGEYGGGFVGAAVLAATGVPVAGERPAPGPLLVTSQASGGATAWLVVDAS